MKGSLGRSIPRHRTLWAEVSLGTALVAFLVEGRSSGTQASQLSEEVVVGPEQCVYYVSGQHVMVT